MAVQGEFAPKNILCVEIAKEYCELIEDTIKENSLDEKIKVLNSDLKSIPTTYHSMFDLVSCNPPYFAQNSGEVGKKAEARHQILCKTADVCQSAEKLLKYGGRFNICQRPEHLCDILTEMRAVGIEPKRLRMVCFTEGREPFLVLVDGKKGGKQGLRILPTLYLTKDGNYTKEYKSIYGFRKI